MTDDGVISNAAGASEPGPGGLAPDRQDPAGRRWAAVFHRAVRQREGIVIGALLLAAAAMSVHLLSAIGRLTFFQDEWGFILGRRTLTLESLMRPHNEHWQALPVLAYDVVFALRGLGSYRLIGLIGIAGHLLATAALYLVLRRRVDPVLAGTASLAALAFAWSDEVLLWPVNLSFTLPVAFGLLATLVWERKMPTRLSDAAGSVAMILAFASGALAVVLFFVAVATMISGRRSLVAFAWPALSLAVFAAWFLVWGRESAAIGEAAAADLALLPSFIATGLATLAAPSLGLDYRFAGPALAVIAIAGGYALGRLRLLTDPRVSVPLLGVLLLYALIGLGRLAAFGPDGARAPRYLYPAFFLLLLGAWPVLEAIRRASAGWARRFFWVAVAVWSVVMASGELNKLQGSITAFEERAADARAELATLDVLRPVLSDAASTTAIDRQIFFGMTTAGYYAATDDLGSPAGGTLDKVMRLGSAPRMAAEGLIGRLLGDDLRPRPIHEPAATDEPFAGLRNLVDLREVGATTSCKRYAVTGSDPLGSLVIPAGRAIAIRTNGQRTFQAFGRVLAEDFGLIVRSGFLVPGDWYAISPAPLPEGLSWKVRLDPPPGSTTFEVCLLVSV